MSDTLGPLATLVGTAAAPVAHWLQLVKIADTESVRRVCEAHGRGATVRTAQRVMAELTDCGLATRARRQHTTAVIAAVGAVISPRSLAHDLIVARLSAIALQSGWLWERDVAGRNEHLADGILTDDEGRRVGVEVEMTRKTIARTRRILIDHGQVTDRYHGVLYVGTADTMRYIDRIATETGTAGVLRGVVPAVDHWTHTIDNDQLQHALQHLPATAAPGPVQQTLPIATAGTAAPRPASVTEHPSRTADDSRNFSDTDFLNFRTPIDPSALTVADRRAAATALRHRLTRADVAGDTRTSDAIHLRQKELGLA